MEISDTAYNDLLSKVDQLETSDQLRLLEDLAALLRRSLSVSERHSILELQGLGKEIWEGIDAQEYVDRERSSWNG